jgi:hypothetical protein
MNDMVSVLSVVLVLFGSLAASSLSARELLTNGSFEEPALLNGWSWDTFGLFSDSGNTHLWHSYYYDPDLDQEVCAHKILHQWALLSQKTDVPSLDLNFSVSARLFCKTERPDTGYYACACVVLDYLDEQDTVLGETRIYSRTGGCPWTNTATLHLIQAADTNRWHNYTFNVNSELDALPGVNRDLIRRIRVGLWPYVRNNC